MSQWEASNLKVGDPVIISAMFSDDRVGTVERLTEKQIIIAGSGSRFWRKNGCEVGGDDYRTAHLYEPTFARVAAVRRVQAIAKLAHYPWVKCPNAILVEVLALLPKEMK